MCYFPGITGSTIKIDQSGDSEGNFSVVAWKPAKHSYINNNRTIICNYHMIPVAYFQQGPDDIPVSESSLFLFILLQFLFLLFSFIS